ncbi:MAG: hypothetical protein KAI83_03920 [Thiomargarita sp.]|nr:hypothetical protein [Thiomargarita sp.]
MLLQHKNIVGAILYSCPDSLPKNSNLETLKPNRFKFGYDLIFLKSHYSIIFLN